MFERFTERARQVVVLAQDEARALRHTTIGTEHLLLGLLREEEGIAARVLESLGVTLDSARNAVVHVVGAGGEETTAGQIPFTPDAKRALELSLREALSMGHNYIGTEHVLLGLASGGQGVGVEILEQLGVTRDRVHDAVITMLGGRVMSVPHSGYASPPKRGRGFLRPVTLLVTGWLLFALALGVGVLVGWAIWG